MFAPNAVVETKGGSINGQASMLEDYTKEMVLRFITFKFNWPKWNKPAAEKGHLQIKKLDEKMKILF